MPEPRSMLPAIEPEPRSQTDLEIGRDLASYKLLFQEAGLDPDTIDTRLLERFALLDEKTPVLDDERLMMQYADKVFDYCDRVDSENAMDVYGRRVVRLGTLLADIGKTGPLDATPEQQTLVTEMYAIDEPFDGNKSVTEYLETFFPNEYQARMETFKTLKLDPDMTMRDFWNMHAKWSFDLVSMGKAPDEIAYTAAIHHLLEGVDPVGIDKNGEFIGLQKPRPIDQREIFVILLDKYDARRRRGGVDHATAIAYLYDRVTNNNVLDSLPQRVRAQFMSCIDDLAEALKSTEGQVEVPQ